jgi:hypothetical protein
MPLAVLDASVLHPAPLRDLLLRVACAGLFEARWSTEIVELYVEGLVAARPDLAPEALTSTRSLLVDGFPDLVVAAPPMLLGALAAGDAHAAAGAAAAIVADADLVLTREPDRYDAQGLAALGLELRHPDDFLVEIVARAPTRVFAAVTAQARALEAPQSLAALLRGLKAHGLARTIDELCAHYYGAPI